MDEHFFKRKQVGCDKPELLCKWVVINLSFYANFYVIHMGLSN